MIVNLRLCLLFVCLSHTDKKTVIKTATESLLACEKSTFAPDKLFCTGDEENPIKALQIAIET
jgi:hypothetical protein